MSNPEFPDLRGLPFYDEPSTYLLMANRLWAWEFSGWKPESLSWKTGCYIHAGLSDNQMNFTGPDVLRLFESLCVNNFETFSIGAMKHAVFCLENGLIASHGILQRNSEEELRFYAGGPWPVYHAMKSKLRVKAEMPRWYLFQVAGPTSLETLERAAGEDLSDIRFLRFRTAKIAGKAVEIARIGMSGNLAYEVRGPIEEGAAVYDSIFKAGKDLGIQRLGWRTYLVNHVEGGFPQMTWTFSSAMLEDAGFAQFLGGNHPPFQITGSVDPADMRARYRTPVEVGWQSTVRLNHEFIGRKAIEAEMAKPRRTVATLRWNQDDVLDIHRSLFGQGEPYRTLDLPTTPTWKDGMLAHADHLMKDGRSIGYSSGTIYSYYFREVLSMACIDVEQSAIGNEVIVQWGDHGRRIKNVRAVVERFPYLTEGRNNKLDTSAKA
ncbi:MAG: aminomethyl transferase family protein [Proteobacteria bacterium]|nr:aminomethyl transferase family protein [Pseudomonadota bacterium]